MSSEPAETRLLPEFDLVPTCPINRAANTLRDWRLVPAPKDRFRNGRSRLNCPHEQVTG